MLYSFLDKTNLFMNWEGLRFVEFKKNHKQDKYGIVAEKKEEQLKTSFEKWKRSVFDFSYKGEQQRHQKYFELMVFLRVYYRNDVYEQFLAWEEEEIRKTNQEEQDQIKATFLSLSGVGLALCFPGLFLVAGFLKFVNEPGKEKLAH